MKRGQINYSDFFTVSAADETQTVSSGWIYMSTGLKIFKGYGVETVWIMEWSQG